MVSDYQSWRSAIPVNGVVVAMTPDGPFPDQFVIEYMLPNGQLGRATVPSQYTTARELEDEVELVYREKDPGLLGFRKTLVTRKDSNPTIVSQRGFPQPEIR